jgi:AcrR family transcriptional regulator
MRYFGGKVGLLDALFDDAWKHLNVRVDRAVAATDDSREALLNGMQAIVTALGRDPDLATLVMFEGRRIRGDEPRVRLSRGFLRFAETVRRLVRQAQAIRTIDAAFDANALTSSLLGATESMIRDRLLAKGSGSRGFAERDIRRTLVAMLDGFERGRGGQRSPRQAPSTSRHR